MTVIGIILGLGLLIGAVLGWVAFLQLASVKRELAALRKQLRHQTDRHESVPAKVVQPAKKVDTWAEPNRSEEPDLSSASSSAASASSMPPISVSSVPSQKSPDLLERLKEQWMVWLGGISIGLAGIFMVRYSIEQGLLGPAARVALSILSGLVLHGVAEWGRRYRGNYLAFAALAGGASSMLYAALLAALLLYQLLPPWLVFALLALVSLATMALAVLHGPVLAILGILGAYVVPLLVDTGSDSILGLYGYSLIITASAILLMHYVYRPWLWAYMLAGSLGWWFLSLTSPTADGFRGFYLFALAYLYLAMPTWDWLLRKADPPGTGGLKDAAWARAKSVQQAPLVHSLVLVIIAFGLSILAEDSITSAIYYWTPLVAVLLVAAGNRESLLWLPALSLAVQGLAWFLLCLDLSTVFRLAGFTGPDQSQFLVYAGWMTFLYFSLSLRNLYSGARNFLWAVLAILVPLFWLALGYLLVTDLSESILWGTVSVVLGVIYLALAAWRVNLQDRESLISIHTQYAVWLILAGHFAYSLAVAIMVREAGLTLALAAQLVSLAFVIQRFDQPKLGILLKVVLAIIVIRLTLNPWLLTYPSDLHWSLWTYGGATALTATATWILRGNVALRPWLEAASLHLLVLTLWAETRYQLYDGNIFTQRFELTEAAINCALWSSLGLVYYLRHKVSQNLKPLYLLASKILLGLALIVYLLMLLPMNPLWGGGTVASRPVLNLLLLAFGFPVVIAALLYRFYDQSWRKYFAVFAGLAGFVFVNLEIRHLWQGRLDISLPTGNGELYTYTIVWLLLAVACLLAGSIRLGRPVYRAGFGLLMLVIGKIFLMDMADLEGLLRVASFMGLGLSLLGLAYLYQRFNLDARVTTPQATASENEKPSRYS